MRASGAVSDKDARLRLATEILTGLWPDTRPQLRYEDCFELLCAVMLSAQTTDEQVNSVTPSLFSRFPDARRMAEADLEEVESLIRRVGFFHTKARHLIAAARILRDEHGGTVPDDMETILRLPGVGRKTANLVLSACFGHPGVIVDTHVARVAVRFGLFPRKDPAAIEDEIRRIIEPGRLTALSHALNRHGKFTCKARLPACMESETSCAIAALCPRLGLKLPKERQES